ncbi:MAG: glycosyltransferase family 2 protein [Myxococcales bacterium]|jgi:glycosyltransferase involved in cell wall biosynthesis
MSADLPAEVRGGTYIVIAAFNEGPAIAAVVSALRAAGYDHVVVVDDGSGDDTGAQALSGGAVVLTHMVNRGQGAALQTGIAYALRRGARYVVTYDADGQHQPGDLPALIAPIAAGEVEICLGSRFIEDTAENMPLRRRLVLKLAVLFTWLTSGLRLTDAHNGFRALSRKAASRIDLHLDRMAHASEIVDQIRQSGLAYREVPVHIRYTDYSMAKGQRSTAAFRIAFDYLIGRLMR